MITGAPPGTVGVIHASGWIKADEFMIFMKHFITFTMCSKEHPVFLLLDNHDSHIFVETLDLAIENGVILRQYVAAVAYIDQCTAAASTFTVRQQGKQITI